jgi:negative regulator of sigma E activity
MAVEAEQVLLFLGRPGDTALDGSWERWGIHGVALEREEYAAARAALVTRVQALLDVALRAA